MKNLFLYLLLILFCISFVPVFAVVETVSDDVNVSEAQDLKTDVVNSQDKNLKDRKKQKDKKKKSDHTFLRPGQEEEDIILDLDRIDN